MSPVPKLGERVEIARDTDESHVKEATEVAHVVPMQGDQYQPIMLAALLLQANQDVQVTPTSELLNSVL